ncbi:MAG: TRAP transporter substrate-binding protein [Synergistales bacterium]|nr:TRAP transporter substrate-binding protein [Synergistales bacterium]
MEREAETVKGIVHNTALRLVFIAVIAVCILAGGSGIPAQAAEYEWKMAMPWPVPAQDSVHEAFIEQVEEATDGRIEITYFPDGQLGTHDEIFHSVQSGSIELGYFAPYVHLVPGGILNWMPWAVMSWDAARMAFDKEDGILWEVMQEAYGEVGMTMLYQASYGPYGLGNNVRPLKSPADLKNLKLRVSGSLGPVRMLQHMGEGTGMTLETVPWADLYDALAKGVVDGCWSMWPSLIELRHAEVLTYYSDLNFLWDINNIVINRELWEELPDDLKAALDEAATEAQAALFDKMQGEIDKFIEELKAREDFHITFLTDKQREVFREASDMGPVWDELCKPWLDEHYPDQNMTEKVRKELRRINEKAIAEKAAN